MSDLKQWIVTGTSMVVEAETEAEAIDRAQDTSGWSWEAQEVVENDIPDDLAVDLNYAIANVCGRHGVPVTETQLDEAAYAVVHILEPGGT